jgi:hypothetical protein
MAVFDAAPMGPDDADSGVVGAVARGSKAASTSHELMDFSVRKGDNGGVVVSETYKAKTPPGRRAGAGFPMLGKTKENPFSAKDGAAAVDHITGLLTQMGVKPAAPAPDDTEPDEGDTAPAPPPIAPRAMPAMPPPGPPGLGPAGQ